MNGQQSPSAPDPKFPQPPQPIGRTHRESALSDTETFTLLAESMANGRDGNGAVTPHSANGHAVNGSAANGHVVNGSAANGDQLVNSHSVDRHNGYRSANGQTRLGSGDNGSHRKAPLSKYAPEWRSIEPAPRTAGLEADAAPTRGDMPPVVPFRIGYAGLDAVPTDDRMSASSGHTTNGRQRFDWSTPILVDEQWELVGAPEDLDPLHGQITEVIDLTRVAPAVIDPDSDPDTVDPEPDDVVTNVDQEFRHVDPPMESPVTSHGQPEATNRILPPSEESNDDESLPPLVFLNTRGDIMPRVGETSNGGNGDTFDRTAAGWDGGEPPMALATSARGVENMADPRGDIEPAADIGRAVESPDDFIEPGLTNVGDTQILPPRATPESFNGQALDSPLVSFDPGPAHTDTVPPATTGADADPRLDELQRIFDQYSGPVIAVIASIAGDRRAIDEALQSTFEAVWKTVDTFDPEQPRGPWMFTLARRQATEQIELARRLEQDSKPGRYPVPSHRQDEAITVDKSWEAWEVRLAVDQLTQAEHDVLRLIHNEGLIHPEIAAQLRTTVGAVKSHAYSGSHRLVELLDHVIRPDATNELSVDQASALTWYLAGVADGSDLGTEERSAVKRVQGQLASATAWINPDAHARDRVVSFARRTLDDPGPLSSGEHRGLAYLGIDDPGVPVDAAQPDVTGRHQVVAEPAKKSSSPWLIVGLSAVGLIALIAAFSLRSGSTDSEPETVRRYQMQASGLDSDATGVVEITTVPTGSRYELEFGGLDASTDEFFYAAWLQSTAGGGVVPLGTFSWQAAGDPLVLSGPTWSDDYDLLVITRSATMTRVSIDDPPVLSVSIE